MGTGRSPWSAAAAAAAVVVVACSSSQQAGRKDASALLPDAGGGNVVGDAGSVSDADSSVRTVAADASDAAPLPSMQTTCAVPIQPVNTSQPTTTIGLNGIPCNEQALRDAVSRGGIIKFYCPGAMSTIAVTQTINLPIDKDTTIDGGNVVAFDGGGMGDAGTGTRIFSFNSPNYRATNTTVTLQNLDILNGNATGTPIPTCPQGTNIDGGGGAIFIRDGKLHVFNVTFTTNQAASLGPAVGGGAIYAEGSLEVIVVKSNFLGNSASNGGAIGSLDSDLTLVNDVFSNNLAKGGGANSVDGGSCIVDGGQSGSGGNGGAVAIDGGSDGAATLCGCTFSHNGAGALGGGLFRTADNMTQDVKIDQTWFDTNTAALGGGATSIHNCNLNISASTLSQNSAPSAGGIQADNTKIDFVNDTFWDNTATTGIGGAMNLSSTGGTIQSCTFAENHADHVTGGFAAAIAGAAVTINDTIFWRNQTMDCMNAMTCQNASSTGQANLQTPASHLICTDPDPPCTTSGTMFGDAMLSPIKTNGGPTRTMLPMMGSPAIGAGMGCPMTDQRGVARNPSGCTIGAVEVQ